jgi:hypothetical protein
MAQELTKQLRVTDLVFINLLETAKADQRVVVGPHRAIVIRHRVVANLALRPWFAISLWRLSWRIFPG